MKNDYKLILASASCRRGELLEKIGINYKRIVPNINENPLSTESAMNYVRRLAYNKAQNIWKSSKMTFPVLGADTIISLNDSILGKPRDPFDAVSCLKKLSWREHQVITGLCIWTNIMSYDSLVETSVKFRVLTTPEINAYCSTDEPYDKAGSYAIQGQASNFIEYVSGSYTNVMGLPLKELRVLLTQAEFY